MTFKLLAQLSSLINGGTGEPQVFHTPQNKQSQLYIDALEEMADDFSQCYLGDEDTALLHEFLTAKAKQCSDLHGVCMDAEDEDTIDEMAELIGAQDVYYPITVLIDAWMERCKYSRNCIGGRITNSPAA